MAADPGHRLEAEIEVLDRDRAAGTRVRDVDRGQDVSRARVGRAVRGVRRDGGVCLPVHLGHGHLHNPAAHRRPGQGVLPERGGPVVGAGVRDDRTGGIGDPARRVHARVPADGIAHHVRRTAVDVRQPAEDEDQQEHEARHGERQGGQHDRDDRQRAAPGTLRRRRRGREQRGVGPGVHLRRFGLHCVGLRRLGLRGVGLRIITLRGRERRLRSGRRECRVVEGEGRQGLRRGAVGHR